MICANDACGHSVGWHEGDDFGPQAEKCEAPDCTCEKFTRAVEQGEQDKVVDKCPTCTSPAPEKHPAVQFEGEVSICPDPWHSSTHAGREALNNAIGHAYYEQYAETLRAATKDPVTNPMPGLRPEDMADADGYSGREWDTGPARVIEKKTVTRWADSAMFAAEPIDPEVGPQVRLLWMTPDPLGAIAATSKMYKGQTVRSLSDVTDEERRHFFGEIQKTHLKAPFEFVQFHFVIEGVTRAFTHQMVRQRTATYAQRSDRFAVQEDGMPVGRPPSLAGTDYYSDPDIMQRTMTFDRLPIEQRQRIKWDAAVADIENAYRELIDMGMPQEDARSILPTNLLTVLHYRTDLRALIEHGGNRLCTQAQFEWRLVFSKIVEAIRNYNPYEQLAAQVEKLGATDQVFTGLGAHTVDDIRQLGRDERWQFEMLADVFRPICYLTGKCEFRAEFDRKCNIRGRVDANEAIGRDSSQWAEDKILMGHVGDNGEYLETGRIKPIFPAEWLLDPGAAR